MTSMFQLPQYKTKAIIAAGSRHDDMISTLHGQYVLPMPACRCLAVHAVVLQELAAQIRQLEKAKLFGVQLVDVDEEDPFKVNIMLKGAPKTPFHNKQLSMTLECPKNYPAAPPHIFFNHALYHPNVFTEDNSLCWSDDDNTGSTYTLEGIIGAVNTLLESPNPEFSQPSCCQAVRQGQEGMAQQGEGGGRERHFQRVSVMSGGT